MAGVRWWLAAAVVALVGCSGEMRLPVYDDDIVRVTQFSADKLDEWLDRDLDEDDTLLLAVALTPADQLGYTSRLGQVIPELTLSHLAGYGWRVAPAQLHPAYALDPNGRFLLAPDFDELGDDEDDRVVLIGTYTTQRDRVLISLRFVDVVTREVVATDDYVLPLGPNTKAMVYTAAAQDYVIPGDRRPDRGYVFMRR